jgi:hypothetical protein
VTEMGEGHASAYIPTLLLPIPTTHHTLTFGALPPTPPPPARLLFVHPAHCTLASCMVSTSHAKLRTPKTTSLAPRTLHDACVSGRTPWDTTCRCDLNLARSLPVSCFTRRRSPLPRSARGARARGVNKSPGTSTRSLITPSCCTRRTPSSTLAFLSHSHRLPQPILSLSLFLSADKQCS